MLSLFLLGVSILKNNAQRSRRTLSRTFRKQRFSRIKQKNARRRLGKRQIDFRRSPFVAVSAPAFCDRNRLGANCRNLRNNLDCAAKGKRRRSRRRNDSRRAWFDRNRKRACGD